MGKSILLDRRAFAYAQIAGTLFIMLAGIAGAFALALGAIWLASQLVLLVFTALVTTSGQLGATWAAADPLTRVLILMCITFVVYWLVTRRKNHA